MNINEILNLSVTGQCGSVRLHLPASRPAQPGLSSHASLPPRLLAGHESWSGRVDWPCRLTTNHALASCAIQSWTLCSRLVARTRRCLPSTSSPRRPRTSKESSPTLRTDGEGIRRHISSSSMVSPCFRVIFDPLTCVQGQEGEKELALTYLVLCPPPGPTPCLQSPRIVWCRCSQTEWGAISRRSRRCTSISGVSPAFSSSASRRPTGSELTSRLAVSSRSCFAASRLNSPRVASLHLADSVVVLQHVRSRWLPNQSGARPGGARG